MSGSDIAALSIVALCVAWVVWRTVRRLRQKGQCGCDHCPSSDDGKPQKPLQKPLQKP